MGEQKYEEKGEDRERRHSDSCCDQTNQAGRRTKTGSVLLPPPSLEADVLLQALTAAGTSNHNQFWLHSPSVGTQPTTTTYD